MIKGKPKNWKLYIYMLLALGMLALLTGCGPKEPAAEKTPSETEKTEVIELTVNDHLPPVTVPSKALDEWGKWLEEQSKGRLKVTIHHGASLLKGNEAYRGVQSGVADMAYYVLDRQDGFFLNTVTMLPFIGVPPREQAGKLYMDLLNKFPEMQKEWKGVKPLTFFSFAPTHIHTAKKVVKTPADLKGMRIFSAETMMADTIKEAGGSVVEMGIEDLYMSLDRGLVDGVVNHYGTIKAWGVLEKLNNHNIFGENGIFNFGFVLIMNEDKFKSLPPDLQKLVEDSKVLLDYAYPNDEGFVNSVVKEASDLKHTVTNLSEAEIKAWQDVTKPVHEKWIKEGEDQKLPARAVFDGAMQMIKETQSK